MSFGIKRRIQMGCGEPLQCRWWITDPLRALSHGNSVAPGGAVQKGRARMSSGARCKS
jgi:hypothetical protein